MLGGEVCRRPAVCVGGSKMKRRAAAALTQKQSIRVERFIYIPHLEVWPNFFTRSASQMYKGTKDNENLLVCVIVLRRIFMVKPQADSVRSARIHLNSCCWHKGLVVDGICNEMH